MRKLLMTVAVSACLAGSAALAQDRDDTSMRTTRESRDVTEGYLREEGVSIKPMVGVIAFTDQFRNETSRLVGGLSIDANVARWFSDSYSDLYIGPSLGAIYSHLGEPTSNFVGTDPDAGVGQAGANLLILPANLKLGYNVGDSFRLSAHGGGNVLYRSVASSMFLDNDSVGTGTDWSIFPNVGGDVEIGFGKNVALSLRPDWTITPGDEFFTGTVGLGIALG
jgi:hypothetical protein